MRVIFFISFIFISIQGFNQTRIIRGKVTFKGDPMPGVSINEKSTINSTTTQGDGDFIMVISDNEEVILVLSYIGPYMEKKINREDTFIHIKFRPVDRSRDYLYGYAGLSLLKSRLINKPDLGPTFSIGYVFNIYNKGIGAELNLISNINPNETNNYYQIGIPLYGYLNLLYNFKLYIGGGYYWTLNNNIFPNDVKLTSGLMYLRKRWRIDLRYYHGLINDGNVIRLMNQNINFGIRYNINI